MRKRRSWRNQNILWKELGKNGPVVKIGMEEFYAKQPPPPPPPPPEKVCYDCERYKARNGYPRSTCTLKGDKVRGCGTCGEWEPRKPSFAQVIKQLRKGKP